MNEVLVNTFFEAKVEQLFGVLSRIAAACREAGIEHEVVGGLAVYLHVNRVDPMGARLTRDVDMALRRDDLDRLIRVAANHGFAFRHAAGVDMLVDAESPKAHSAVHLVFSGERVRPHYVLAVPDPAEAVDIDGYRVAPVEHLLRMKLTSYRPKDMAHVVDMLAAGLITPPMEVALPEELRTRLDAIRAMEQ